ncbi:TPA: hypothetical protein SMH97_004061 [Serratia marcescens]|nr:hypothetical protein [Serratia marcescens]
MNSESNYSELKAATIAGHKTCDCHSYNADDGTVPNVILEVPDNIRRYTDGRERVCIDACIADAILHLWERGLPTLNSCCGHNKHEPQIIIPDVDFEPGQYFEALAEIDKRHWIVSRWERVDHTNKSLSKPVAEVVSKFGDPEAFGEREIKLLTGIQQMAYGTKFYSQEYVSALQAEIREKERSLVSNCVDYEYDLIEMKRRAEAAEQRVTELEAKLSEMTTFRDNALKKALRYFEALLELRAKLATPVRLQSPWVDKVGNRWLLEGTTADVIRAAGFKIEGED